MLLFDDSQKLEKSLGEEAAAVLAHVLERADQQWRQDLATKADLKAEAQDVRIEMQAMKNELFKWMVGGFITQTALLMAVVLTFLK